MKDETKQRLQNLSDEEEVPFEEVSNRFDKKLEEFEEKFQGTGSEREEMEAWVASIVEQETRNFGEGNVEGMPFLSLGAEFRDGKHFYTDGDAIIGAGIVNPENSKPGLATVCIDTADGIDPHHAIDVFEPLTTSRIHVGISEVGTRDNDPVIRKYSKPTYQCESTGKTELEIVDPDDVSDDDPISELPQGRDAQREFINEHFFGPEETLTIQDVPTNLAATNDAGFPAALGVDMKRIRGRIVDTYVQDEDDMFSFGNITLVDETIQVDEDVPAELVTDRQRIPGLNVSLAPPYNVYGEDSLVDVYGYVGQRQDTGTYNFNAFGIVAIVPMERDRGVEDEAEEEVI